MATAVLSKKAQKAKEREDAIQRLRELCPPGSTVFTVLRHVSRSGMMRHIAPMVAHDGEVVNISGLVSDAIEWTWVDSGAIKASGCGMDMGFHLVYTLSRVLYRDGFACVGREADYRTHCPSNDHSNGDRDYTPHQHSDGGYALRHRWL